MQPVVDLVLVFDEVSEGHFGWPEGLPKKLESSFARGAVGFPVVDFFVREDAVFPGGRTTARAWEDVVDVGFREAEFFAGVLAAAAITLEEAWEAELEALARDAIELTEDDDGRDADPALSGADGGIFFSDGKALPIGPRGGDHPVGALDVEAGGLVIDHGSEDLGRSGGGEGEPVTVEDKDGGFVEMRHF